MGAQAAEIFEELRQICEQYKNEVPGRRRAWPKSIKDRVFALQRQGIRSNQIAKRVPIPYATIMSWNVSDKRKGAFLPVKVVKSATPPTVTVGGRPKRKHGPVESKVMTVTVVTPKGLRIEGLPIEAALDLLKWEAF